MFFTLNLIFKNSHIGELIGLLLFSFAHLYNLHSSLLFCFAETISRWERIKFQKQRENIK